MTLAFKGGKDLHKSYICLHKSVTLHLSQKCFSHTVTVGQDRHVTEMSVSCFYTLGYKQRHILRSWHLPVIVIPCDIDIIPMV